ncbi:hypothetical protein CBS147343_2265 [Aspergillus niger]|nr:hypothetical protein CBS147371_7844 [Aspergillus niger]KAI2985240.1 hypothetical protein CBS147344_6378 [Aspergillus niger]KAI3087398.1 hypothetical protein CBS147343_2265 [Aspergillus niger]
MATSSTAGEVDALLSDHSTSNRGPEMLGACITSMIFCVIGLSIRVWAQSLIHRIWTADCILIILAAIFTLATAGCVIAAVASGMGQHAYWVISEDPHPPERMAFVVEMSYIITIIQAPALMFTKLSVLVFYQRAFSTIVRGVRWTIWGLFAFCLGLGVASTIVFVCACLPPQMFWLRVYPIFGYEAPQPLEDYTCMPQRTHLCIPLLLDLFSELILLGIPAVVLWNLQMALRRKIIIIFTFSLGLFVTAISAVRFYYAWTMVLGGDMTWADTDTCIWTTVQICFGIVTACIPASAPLLRLRQTPNPRPWNKQGGYMLSINYASNSRKRKDMGTESMLDLQRSPEDDVEDSATRGTSWETPPSHELRKIEVVRKVEIHHGP